MFSKIALLCLLVYCVSAQIPRFHVVKEWHYVNFTWPNEDSLLTATAKGLYIPENNVMTGVNYYEGYYYLALPRMRNGVPVTLGRIPETGSTAPLIEPFPSWEMNNLGDCNALQNVQNLEIDAKGQAWILDIGRTATLNPTASTACAPKLVIFDIRNNRTTTIYTFPEEVASRNSSFLYDIAVDDTDSGYAYITDNSGRDPGIIVYSVKENHSWKIRHSRSMRADRSVADFRVNDVVISSPINIAGIAIGPKAHLNTQNISLNEDRDVYYSPISSVHLYAISSSVLRNERSANDGREYEGFVRDVGVKASETDGMLMDNKGVLYYGLISSSSIAVWDSSKPFASTQRVIAKDPTYIQWPNSFAFDDAGNLVVLTNKLQLFIYGKMSLDDYNFRLLKAQTGSKSYVYDDETLIYSAQESSTKTPPEWKAEPQPKVVPESKAAPEPKAEPEPQPEPAPKANSTPKSESAVQSEPEPKAEPQQETKANSTSKDGSVVVTAVASSASHFVFSVVTVMLSVSLTARS